MKVLLLMLLITYSLNYNAANAVAYAKQWWNGYNPAYNNYNGSGGDCANFVSQCLIAGGQSLSGCSTDGKGCVPGVSNLKSCLTKKGWKSKIGYTNKFKAGYPFFTNDLDAMLATVVSGKDIIFCGHSGDRCDKQTSGDQYT